MSTIRARERERAREERGGGKNGTALTLTFLSGMEGGRKIGGKKEKRRMLAGGGEDGMAG